MKKILSIIIALGFVAMLAMPAFASDSRVTALAGAGNYLEDDYNIFNWPATLPSYSNTVWMSVHNSYWDSWDWEWNDYNHGNYPYTMIGASYGLGEDGHYGTLAMFFFENVAGLNPYGYYQNVYTGNLDSKFSLMYGYSMDSASFGIYINRADNYYKYTGTTETSTDEDKYAYTTIGAGARFDVGDKGYADIAFDVNFASSQDQNTSYGDITNDGSLMYGVRARMFYEYNETVTFVPYFGYRAYDFSLKADSVDAYAADNWGDKCMMLNFGVGANIKVNEDNMLLFAVEPFRYMKGQPSAAPDSIVDEYTYTAMPRFYLALESDVKDWLTFRVGGMKELGKWDEKEGGTNTSEEYVDTWGGFQYFMGLGFHVGDFDIDCVVNNELPYHMGYWLTGYGWNDSDGYHTASMDGDGGSAPMYMVTGTYHF